VTNKDIVVALEEGAKKWIKKPGSFEEYDKMFATQLN
jgi:hypothetical protein